MRIGFLVDVNGRTRAFAWGSGWGIEMPSFSTSGTIRSTGQSDRDRKLGIKLTKMLAEGAAFIYAIVKGDLAGGHITLVKFMTAEAEYADAVLEGETKIVADEWGEEPADIISEPATIEVINEPTDIRTEGTGAGAGTGGRGPINKKKTDPNPDGLYAEDHSK
jgi:hypothetical protein